VSVQRRGTASGPRYDLRLRTADGRVYTRTFRTRDEARSYERRELTARDRGEWIDPSARLRSVAEVAADWLASNPARLASTRARDHAALARYILPALGGRRIGAVTPGEVQALVTSMAESLAPSSVARNYRVEAAVFRYACDRDYIGKNPCRRIRLPRVDATEVHVFSPDELVVLADAMPTEHAAMVWLGAVLGLRWSEVAALRLGAFDLLGRSLAVDGAVTRDGKGRPVLGAPKSAAGRRTLAMPDALVEVVAAHAQALGLTGADPEALLFPDAAGGLLRYSNWLRRTWWAATVATGVGPFVLDAQGKRHFEGPRFHDLRRTSATGLVAACVDVKTAQTPLGHSAVRLTLELYAQAVPESERSAADALGERLMPRPAAEAG
jgi:integrase